MSSATMASLFDYLTGSLTQSNMIWLGEQLIAYAQNKSQPATISAAEKKTRAAMAELESGNGTVCNSFEEYLAAVQ